MASSFPGMDEVIRALQQAEADEARTFNRRKPQTAAPTSMGQVPSGPMRGGQGRFPTADSPAKAPMVRAGGAFQATAGAGGRALGALRGAAGTAGRVVNNPATVGVSMAAPTIMQGGQSLADVAMDVVGNSSDYFADGLQPATGTTPERDRRIQNQRRQGQVGLPNIQPRGPVNGPPLPEGYGQPQPAPQSTYLPEELMDMQAQEQVQQPVEDVASQDEIEILGDPEFEAQQEEIPPEMLTEAQLLPQQAPPRVQNMKGSEDTLSALGKNRAAAPVRRETPKRGFLGHVGEFFRTGGRNRERDDYNEELKTYQAANSFTDPDKLRANVAEKDVFSTKAMNHQGEMAKYAGQGVTPADKFEADLYGEETTFGRNNEAKKEAAATDHEYNLTEIEAGKKGNKSLDQILGEFQTEIATKFPDLDPELLKKYGVNADPEALSSIRKGREGGSGDKVMQTMMLLQALRGGGSSAPDKTPASTKMKEEPKKTVKKDLNLSDLITK